MSTEGTEQNMSSYESDLEEAGANGLPQQNPIALRTELNAWELGT